MMNQNVKISRIFFYLIFSITLVFSAGFAFFWIGHELRDYRVESRRIHSNYIDLSKSTLKKEVQSIVQYIEYRKSKVRTRLKKDIRDRTYQAHAIAVEIYKRHHGSLPDAQIRKQIKEFLALNKYNDGRGYYFAISTTGRMEVASEEHLEGQEGLQIQDPGGKFLVKEMIEIGRESGEGFIEYLWTKPGSEGANFPKIAFVKLFEPYNLLIGTGEYLDYVENDLQKEILDWLNELKYNDSYIAAFTFEGIRLAYYKKEELGQSKWDYVDANGVKVVQEGINLSKTEEGGFIEYIASTQPTTGKPARKISFFMGVPDWRWAISTGVYLDEIDAYVESKKSELSKSIADSVIYTLVIFLLITSVLLSGLAYIFKKINASFQAFSSFFDRAAKEATPIDPGMVNFAEFKRLALSANRMVAQRRKAEDALRSSEARYRAVVQDQTELICRFLPDSSIIFVNDAYCRFFGKPCEDVIGSGILDSIYPPDIPVFKAHIASLTPDDPVGTAEHRSVNAEGKIFWLQRTDRAIFGQYGTLIEFQGVGRDITEQKRAEHALFESERRFREMLEKVKLLAVILDMEGNIIFCNEFLLEITGWAKEDVQGRNWFDLFIPAEERESFRTTFKSKMPLGDFPGYYENEVLTRTGERKLIAWNNTPLRDADGNVIGGTSIGEDITERNRAEAERIRLVTAIEQSAEAIFITDTNWKISYVNPAFERISGYAKNELIGQVAGIFKSNRHDDSFYAKIRDTLRGGEVWSGSLISARKDGSTYEAEVTASPVRDQSGTIINYVSIHRDITHEVKLEKDLRQAQKMEAIGTLAGGIAHDFNNILTAINGYTEMALLKAPEGTQLRRNLDQVLKAGTRARDLVKQILAFSRQTEQERKPVQISPIVREALKLLRSSLPTTIEIRQKIDVAAEEGVVLADPTQIHQVLMNLCTNSAHSMRARGGILSVSLTEIEIDASLLSKCPGLKQGNYMKLVVSDTGHGMQPEIMERIFDPYFTTKKPGEGTGVGLAVVQGIVKNHGGAISVYSEPGEGTTFSVYLPKIGEAISPIIETMESLPGGNERILFVDDENGLAELGKEMLESLGYQVTAQVNSLEALELFRQRPHAFELVITDMTMPILTGLELAKEILSIRPEVPIILCTGFSEILTGNQQKETGIREFIMKPYAITHLARVIREVLAQKAESHREAQ